MMHDPRRPWTTRVAYHLQEAPGGLTTPRSACKIHLALKRPDAGNPSPGNVEFTGRSSRLRPKGTYMGEVADFEHQLLKQAGRRFAQWHQIDLHNHSPASFDYQGNRSSALQDTADVINARGLSVVMFTDHACLPDPAFVDNLRNKTPSLVITGTELNVVVEAWGTPQEKVGKNMYFHLLIGFKPGMSRSEDFWLQKIYHECGEQKIDCGGKTLKAIVKNLDSLAETLKDSEAIIIPAHLHSGGDAYKSRSIDKIYTDGPFLKYARDHFTALEVLNPTTAEFFNGTRSETGFLHKSCVMSSDAHKAEDLGNRVTYAQLEELNFDELKAALELPFRISLSKPEVPETYIIGVHIEGSFFKDTWVELSPYCNVLIGVKGTGKTSVLECVRFALGVEVPSSRTEEVQKHLDAILGPGGRVRVLVKRADGAKMLIERSLANRSFQVTFDDDTKHPFQSPEGFQFPAHVLGWHEIEHVAVDPQIRQLYLNKIAGEAELRKLDEEVKIATTQIRRKHELVVRKFEQIKSFEERINRLEELQKGLQKLTDDDLIELKEKYELGVSDNSSIATLADQLENLHPTLKQKVSDLMSGIEAVSFLGSGQLQGAITKVKLAVQVLVKATTYAADTLDTAAQKAAQEVLEGKLNAEDAFQELATEYRQAVNNLTPEQQKLLESHIKVADETRQLQSLRAEHGELGGQTEALFGELRDLCSVVISRMDERTDLRKSKVSQLSGQISSSGVRLNVVPYVSKWRFETIGKNFSRSWELYQEVRKQFPESSRFHEFLIRAYEDLRVNSTNSQYAKILQSPDLGPMLDAYEEDDLAIEFDPKSEAQGAPVDAQYKRIDELSAGQRCTAVFPILLKLEKAPLLIDQPEDNLDNRHIANKIAGAVLENKKTRQMVFTSHNANLVVMSDPEKIMAFEATEGTGRIEKEGFLAHSKSRIMRSVLEILDGGERALELRVRKYGQLWKV